MIKNRLGATPRAKLFLSDADNHPLFGDGKYRLLKIVAEEGSLQKAALKLKRGYRKAWQDIRKTEEALGRRIVISNRGGSSGGSTDLTEFGRRLVLGWEKYRNAVALRMNEAYEEHLACITS